MDKQQFEQVNFAELEAKSRFASLFPKDIKFLINLVDEFESGKDLDHKTGFSESKMMKERVLLKLNAYLDLFNGLDPEAIDPNMISHVMPEDFKNKYYDQIFKSHQEYLGSKLPQRY